MVTLIKYITTIFGDTFDRFKYSFTALFHLHYYKEYGGSNSAWAY